METVNMHDAQSNWDAAADYNKKRGRDDDQEMGNGPCSFSEHRNKRLQQSLPMRMSPKAGSPFLSGHAVTPLNASPAQLRHSHLEASSYLQAPEQSDMEADMDMATDNPCVHRDSNHLAPEADHTTATQRLPTPVQPSFAAQIRGQQHHWSSSAMENDADNVPRTLENQADWQTLQHNRRLPSPISEYEDGMNVSLQPPSPHGMEHPNAMMGLEGRASSHPPDGESPSPERRGHMRSKHTINTWTWQPGMKKSFSVGYRQDCEKCRLKVPGHFNHIIISWNGHEEIAQARHGTPSEDMSMG